MVLALPMEEAKGLRGVAGSPAARSLGISLPAGLRHCGLGDTGQSGQRPCPSAAWPGSGLAKTGASWKNTRQERSQLGCRQLPAHSPKQLTGGEAEAVLPPSRHEITAGTANPRSNPPPALDQSGRKGAESQS